MLGKASSSSQQNFTAHQRLQRRKGGREEEGEGDRKKKEKDSPAWFFESLLVTCYSDALLRNCFKSLGPLPTSFSLTQREELGIPTAIQGVRSEEKKAEGEESKKQKS